MTTKFTDHTKCIKTLFRISCLILLLVCMVGMRSVQAQTVTTFAPSVYNQTDPGNTNWNEPKNWSWYPGTYQTGHVTMVIFGACNNYTSEFAIGGEATIVLMPNSILRMYGDFLNGIGGVVDIRENSRLQVDKYFKNLGEIKGEGSLHLESTTQKGLNRTGSINCANFTAKTFTNNSRMNCKVINVTELENASFIWTEPCEVVCSESFQGKLNNQSYGNFTNNGNFNGNVVNSGTWPDFTNNGTFNGSISTSNAYSSIKNNGSLNLNGNSSIASLTNSEDASVTINATLDSGRYTHNFGLITNNGGFNIIDATGPPFTVPKKWENNGTIINNSMMNIHSDASFNNSGGVIKGSGENIATGQWTNRGTVSPGNSPGKLIHNGQYYESGTLLIEIGGTTAESEYDVLEIGNYRSHTILTSTLEVRLINGFSPSDGDSFTILTAQARGGTFSTLNLPDLDPGLEWKIDYNPQDITLRVASLVVPVTWLDFTVSAMDRDENNVRLDWSTAEEINNLGFEVERSADGSNWEKIGFVEASNEKLVQYDYTFQDSNPFSDINYYRLKQMDYDGTHDYSVVRTIEINQENMSFSVYPNPSPDGFLQVVMEGQEEDLNLSIIDFSGRIIHAQKVETTLTGNQINLNMLDITAGTYIVRLQGKQHQSQLKWVKL